MPAEKLDHGEVYVSLRGKAKGFPSIRVVDRKWHGVDHDRPETQFYDVEMKIEAGETVFTVWHTGDDLNALQETCHALFDAGDVEVSGKLVWSGSEPCVAADQLGPVKAR